MPSAKILMPGKVRFGTPSKRCIVLASTARSAGLLCGWVTSRAATWALSSPFSDRARYSGNTPTSCSVGRSSNSDSLLPALAAASIQAVTP
ncbi:hypothetical protein D3C81_1653810 [compost metagenome]